MSASVKAYFALKMAGDDIDAPHMKRAREAILAHGGAAQSNVFTRALLALYRQVPWRAVPVMPVEIMLLPRWFPFHLDKISYWARTTLVPLMALMALRPKPVNRRGVGVPELFVVPPEKVRKWHSGQRAKEPWKTFFARTGSSSCALPSRFSRNECGNARLIRRWRSAMNGLTARMGSARSSRRCSMSCSCTRRWAFHRTIRSRRRTNGARKVAGYSRRRGVLPALRIADLG